MFRVEPLAPAVTLNVGEFSTVQLPCTFRVVAGAVKLPPPANVKGPLTVIVKVELLPTKEPATCVNPTVLNVTLSAAWVIVPPNPAFIRIPPMVLVELKLGLQLVGWRVAHVPSKIATSVLLLGADRPDQLFPSVQSASAPPPVQIYGLAVSVSVCVAVAYPVAATVKDGVPDDVSIK